MVDSTVRDLFASLENTLRERFRLIEDVLRLRSSSDEVQIVDSSTLLQEEVRELREEVSALRNAFAALRLQVLSSPPQQDPPLLYKPTLQGIEILPKKEVVVQIPLEQTNRVEVVKVAQPKLEPKVEPKLLPKNTIVQAVVLEEEEELVEEEVVEEEVVEEEVVEEEVIEEEEVVEEEVIEEEEVVEEEEGVELEEFEYKGSTYYRDTENKVFAMDEEGNVGDPIGLWNIIKQRITRLPS